MKGQFIPYKDENPVEHWPYVTVSLILANTLVFLWTILVLVGQGETAIQNFFDTWGFVPVNFVIITLFTSIFLHGGLLHLIGNMLFLYIYGDNVEDKFGKVRFILFYIVAGLFAGLVHFLSDPFSDIPAVGASGAISGVLGAYLVMFPRVKVRAIGPFYMIYRIRASVLIGIWFVIQLIFGFFSLVGFGQNIAFFAHIGGFIFGYLIGRIYCKGRPKTEPKPAFGFFPKR